MKARQTAVSAAKAAIAVTLLSSFAFTPLSSSGSALYWSGATNGNWSLASSDANWTGGATSFSNTGNYSVVLSDSGAHTNPITIVSGGVQPTSVLFTSNTATYSFSGGPIAGGAPVALSGSGLVTFMNSNTYTGATTISGGTLQLGTGTIGQDGSIGGTSGVTNNSALVYSLFGSQTASYAMSGSGSLTTTGSNVLTLTGNSPTFTGTTTVSAGTLQIGNGGTSGSVGGPIVNQSALVITRSDAQSAYAVGNGISGSGSLTVNGGGYVTLNSGANTYTGITTITNSSMVSVVSAGTLNNVSSAFGPTPATFVPNQLSFTGAGGSLVNMLVGETAGSSLIIDANRGIFVASGATATFRTGYGGFTITINSVISGSGNIAKTDTITDSLILNAANTFSGTTGWNAIGGQAQGGLIQLGNALALQNSTVNENATGGGNLTFTGGIGTFTIGGLMGTVNQPLADLNNTAVTLLVGNDNANTTYSGGLTGLGSLTKIGSGALNLSGANTYSGGTTVTSGTLSLTGSLAGGGAIAVAAGAAFTEAGTGLISGAASLATSGATTLAGTNTYTLGTTINSGSLSLTGSLTGGGAIAVAPGAAFTEAGTGLISGAASLATNGATTLAGSNAYSLGTTIGGGVLNINADAALGASAGTLTFANNGSLQAAAGLSLNAARNVVLNGGVTATLDTNGNAMSIPGVISGAGGIAKISAGTLALSGANTYGGGTTINVGVLNINADAALGAVPSPAATNLTFSNNSTLQFGANNVSLSANRGIAINGGVTATFDTSGYAATIAGTIANGPGGGALFKANSGTLFLTGSNTYSGGTTINSGTLNINSDAALGTPPGSPATNVTFSNNSTLQFGANNVALSASRNIAINSGVTATFDNNGYVAGIAGAITGSGSLATAGAGILTLSGSNTYSGSTTVNIGTLNVASPGSLGATAISVGGSGALAATGTTSVGGNVSLASGGQINLASSSSERLSIGGRLTLVSGAALDFDLGSTAGASSLLAVAGSVSMPSNGVTVNITTGSVIANGNYTLLTAASGTLAEPILGSVPAIGTFNFNSSTVHTLILTVSVNPYVATAYWTGSASQYNGNGSTNPWNDHVGTGATLTSNWSTNPAGTTDAHQIPGPITDVYFTAANALPSVGNTLNTQLNAPYSIQGLFIAVPTLSGSQITSTNINLNGKALTIGGDGLTLAGTSQASATLYGTGSVLLGNSAESWANNNATLPLTVNSAIAAVSGPTTLTFSGSGTGGVVLGGVLSDGSGLLGQLSLVFNQAGTTQLNAANTFTGGVTITSGTVQLGSGGSISNTSRISDNGTLAYSIADAQVQGCVISGSGSLVVQGPGMETLTNSNTFSGVTTVSGGTLQLGLGTAGNDGSVAGNITDNATLAFNYFGTPTYSGVISGSGGIANIGPGTSTLAAANSFSGGLALNNGLLQLANSAAVQNGTVTISGGSLAFASGIGSFRIGGLAGSGNLALQDTSANPVALSLGGNGHSSTYSGVLSAPGSLTMVAPGMLTLASANTYTGNTLVSGGTLALGNSLALQQSTLDTSGSGSLSFGTLTSATVGGLTGGGGGLVLNNASGAAVALSVGNNGLNAANAGSISGSGSLIKIGSGTQVLAGVNTYSGSTTLAAGELSISSSNNIGGANAAVNFNGGTLQVTGTNLTSIDNLPVNWSTFIGGFDIAAAANTFTVASSLGGTGGLSKSGAGLLSLAAANTLSGPTTVNGGTLNVAHPLALQNSTVTVNSTGALTVNSGLGSATLGALSGSGNAALNNALLTVGGNGANTTYSGVLSNAAGSPTSGFVKTGSGMMTLTGNSTYSGATLIQGGVLQLRAAEMNPTAGLVDYYPFTGNANDAFGASNGTLGGGATVSASGGRFGTGAVYLNGTGGNVNMGALSAFTTASTAARTISAWVYPTATPGANFATDYFGFYTGGAGAANQEYYFDYNGGFVFTEYNDDSAPLGTYANNQWVMLTATWAGGTNNPVTMYVNGVSVGNLSSANASITNLFGIDNGRTDFAGYENDLRVYNTALTAGQVAQLYSYNPAAGINGALPAGTPVTISNGATLDMTNGTQTIASLSSTDGMGSQVLLGGGVLTVGNSASTLFDGAISGSGGSLIKQGAGMLTLSGNNTYSGTTTISGGTLQVGNGGSGASIGSTSAVVNNSTLVFNNSDATALGAVISGSGNLLKTGPGNVTLSAASTYSGPTLIQAGTLKLAGGSHNAIAVTSSAAFLTGGAQNNTNAFTVGSGANLLVVEISWRGTNVNTPTVQYNGANLTQAVSEVNGNAGTNQTDAAIYYLSSPPTGAGDNLVVNYAAAPTDSAFEAISLSGVNLNTLTSGTTAVGGGALAAATLSMPMTVAAPGSWEAFATGYRQGSGNLLDAAITAGNGTLVGTSNGNVYNNTDANIVEAGGLIANSTTSSVTLQETAGANPGGGGIWSMVGDVFAPASNAGGLNVLPVTTVLTIAPSGTLDLGGAAQTVASLSDAAPGQGGTIQNSGTGAAILTLSPTSGSTTFSGQIVGGGTLGSLSLVMSGAGLQYLAGANTYNGGTQVAGGTLQLGNAHALGTGALAANAGVLDLNGYSVAVSSFSGAAGTVTSSQAGPVTLTVNQTSVTSFGGTLQNGAGLLSLVVSGGTLNVSGVNTYSGGTTLNAGMLVAADGPNTSTMTSALGSGILTLNGGTLAAGPAGGSVAGLVQAGSGHHTIAPGAALSSGFGTLNLNGGLTASASTTLTFNVNQSPSGLYDGSGNPIYIGDLINMNSSSLTVGGGASITFGSSSPTNLGDYRLIANLGTGSVNATGFSVLAAAPSGDRFTLSTSVDPGNLDLVLAAVLSGPANWVAGNGNWSTGTNWTTGTYPSGQAVSASMTNTNTSSGGGSGQVQVTLDVPVTLGTLTLGNSDNSTSGFTITSYSPTNTLTLNNSGSGAAIQGNNGAHAISAAMQITDTAGLTVSMSNASTLDIFGNISDLDGNETLTLNGDGTGTLYLSGTNTYGQNGGGTVVNAGLLVVSDGGLASGSNLSVGDTGSLALLGGAVLLGSPARDNLSGGGLVAAPVPEPGALALLAAGLLGAVAGRRYSRRRLARRRSR